jgi:hypothetical protein
LGAEENRFASQVTGRANRYFITALTPLTAFFNGVCMHGIRCLNYGKRAETENIPAKSRTFEWAFGP